MVRIYILGDEYISKEPFSEQLMMLCAEYEELEGRVSKLKGLKGWRARRKLRKIDRELEKAEAILNARGGRKIHIINATFLEIHLIRARYMIEELRRFIAGGSP